MRNSSFGPASGSASGFLPCLILALSFGLAPAVLAAQHDVHLLVRQTAQSSLTLIKPTDPEFDSTVDTYFPGLAEEDQYQQAIRPFLILVRNDTPLTAVAYAIVWKPDYAPGWASPLRAIFVNRPLMFAPAMVSIPPEGIRLVSPVFNVTPEEYAATRTFADAYPPSFFPSTNGLASPPDAQLDGVVYADGTFTGPDSTHIFERCVAGRFAARDEVLEALRFIRFSSTPPVVGVQLLQALAGEAQRDARANQTSLLARYVRGRGRSAKDLQRILQNRGLSGFESALQSFVTGSGGGENASMFDHIYRNLSANDPRVFGNPWRP